MRARQAPATEAPIDASGDPLPLARGLLRCPSVTPADAGAQDLLAAVLERLGFTCKRLRFATPGSPPVDNLYARLGEAPPVIAFAGHTDVVPPGDLDAWRYPPFGGEVVDGALHGRGAVDMKGAIACFVAAVARLLDDRRPEGSIALLITGDEEGPAVDGTRQLVQWLAARGERLDACLVGEPTNPKRLGQMIKIGRRGSLSGHLTVRGTQGHVAYPERADNPIPRLLALLAALDAEPLDGGSARFEPSRLVPTSVDVGNEAGNVIPATARARFNVRFNDRWDAGSLEAALRQRLDRVDPDHELILSVAGEAFVTCPGPLTTVLTDAIRAELGTTPELSTSGGTSDARFIKDHCPVVEFGLISETIHQVDEQVAIADLEALTRVYRTFLHDYLGPS